MSPHWLGRMALWTRRPPSARRVALVLGILAACALLYAIEQLWGWPDWLSAERLRRPAIR